MRSLNLELERDRPVSYPELLWAGISHCLCRWPSVLCLACVCASHFSHVQLFADLWIVASQAPLSTGFSRQDYWSESPCPSPGGERTQACVWVQRPRQGEILLETRISVPKFIFALNYIPVYVCTWVCSHLLCITP